MGPREGAVGCIWLSSDFSEPRWREALIVGVKGIWVQTLVQTSQKEVEDSGVSSCAVCDKCYCLVEAKTSQVRMGPPNEEDEILELDADRKDLLNRGQSLLGSDEDLAYATASDPPALSKKQRGKR